MPPDETKAAMTRHEPRRSPQAMDLRGLAPPEPLERVLAALEGAGPWKFLLARDPWPLYALLQAGGWRYRVNRLTEGVELVVEKGKDR